MAALIMVSTFGANSGLILSGGGYFLCYMAKDGFVFLNKQQELNKNQVPAKAMGAMYLGLCLGLSGRIWRLINLCYFASLLFLYP
jgi:APA family basic amino acid/polyamine antiporter